MFTETSTVILYLCITVCCYGLASLSYRKVGRNIEDERIIQRGLLFVLSCAIASFFLICTHIGTDYNQYIHILNYVSWDNLFSFTNAEPGFKLIWILLKPIIHDPNVFLALVKLIGILLAYITIWNVRDRINVGYAVLGYFCFVYFDSFNLIRMIFAVNICIFAYGQLMQKKNKSAIIVSLIAITMHTSALLFLVAVVFYIWISNKGSVSNTKYICIVLILLFVLFGIGTIYDYLLSNFSLFAHYNKYSLITDYSISPILILRYIPVVYCVYSSWGRLKDDKDENLCFIFLIVAIFVSLLSYSLKTITRANSYFYVLQFLFIPFYMDVLQFRLFTARSKKLKIQFMYRDLKILIVLYFFLFFAIKMTELNVSEIQAYSFYWR